MSNLITVTLTDTAQSIKQVVEIPADRPINQIIPRLVDALTLPTQGPAGPIAYKLSKDGKQLQDSDTLSEAGVKDNDTLTLVSEQTPAYSYRIQ